MQSGVGVVYEPTQILRKAKAEADAAIIKAEGDIKVQEIVRRAAARVDNKELRRQRNIEAIVAEAQHHLPESVNDEKVDQDRMVQFFEHSQDVGNNEMQTLWAKLLAGEVAAPGTYSLRTLALVKTLTKQDAEMFTTLCRYLWSEEVGSPATLHPIIAGRSAALLNDNGLNLSGLHHLQAISLLDANRVFLGLNESSMNQRLYYFGRLHTFSPTTGALMSGSRSMKPHLEAHSLTSIGRELAPISGARPDEVYREALMEDARAMNLLLVEVAEPE